MRPAAVLSLACLGTSGVLFAGLAVFLDMALLGVAAAVIAVSAAALLASRRFRSHLFPRPRR